LPPAAYLIMHIVLRPNAAVLLQGLMERFERKSGGFLGFDLSSLFGQK
jgi:hypothetical protein